MTRFRTGLWFRDEDSLRRVFPEEGTGRHDGSGSDHGKLLQSGDIRNSGIKSAFP